MEDERKGKEEGREVREVKGKEGRKKGRKGKGKFQSIKGSQSQHLPWKKQSVRRWSDRRQGRPS